MQVLPTESARMDILTWSVILIRMSPPCLRAPASDRLMGIPPLSYLRLALRLATPVEIFFGIRVKPTLTWHCSSALPLRKEPHLNSVQKHLTSLTTRNGAISAAEEALPPTIALLPASQTPRGATADQTIVPVTHPVQAWVF